VDNAKCTKCNTIKERRRERGDVRWREMRRNFVKGVKCELVSYEMDETTENRGIYNH
jgi:hypothetical protein